MFQNCTYSTRHCGIVRTCFFKLRIVRSKLRSLIGQKLLESLLPCFTAEFDLLEAIDNDTVYRKLCLKSPEFRKLLILMLVERQEGHPACKN